MASTALKLIGLLSTIAILTSAGIGIFDLGGLNLTHSQRLQILSNSDLNNFLLTNLSDRIELLQRSDKAPYLLWKYLPSKSQLYFGKKLVATSAWQVYRGNTLLKYKNEVIAEWGFHPETVEEQCSELGCSNFTKKGRVWVLMNTTYYLNNSKSSPIGLFSRKIEIYPGRNKESVVWLPVNNYSYRIQWWVSGVDVGLVSKRQLWGELRFDNNLSIDYSDVLYSGLNYTLNLRDFIGKDRFEMTFQAARGRQYIDPFLGTTASQKTQGARARVTVGNSIRSDLAWNGTNFLIDRFEDYPESSSQTLEFNRTWDNVGRNITIGTIGDENGNPTKAAKHIVVGGGSYVHFKTQHNMDVPVTATVKTIWNQSTDQGGTTLGLEIADSSGAVTGRVQTTIGIPKIQCGNSSNAEAVQTRSVSVDGLQNWFWLRVDVFPDRVVCFTSPDGSNWTLETSIGTIASGKLHGRLLFHDYSNVSFDDFSMRRLSDNSSYRSGLIAASSFEPGNASVAVDETGVLKLNVSGGVSRVAGYSGNGFNFTGVGGQIIGTVDGTFQWNANETGLTACAWARPIGGPAVGAVFSMADKSNNREYIRVDTNSTGHWRIVQAVAGGGLSVLLETANLSSMNTWQHMCLTHNTTNTSIYRNGVLIGSNLTNAKVCGDGDFTKCVKTVTLGADARTFSTNFNGTLDEFVIWSRGLTPSEILSFYNDGGRASERINLSGQSNVSASYLYSDPGGSAQKNVTIDWFKNDVLNQSYFIDLTSSVNISASLPLPGNITQNDTWYARIFSCDTGGECDFAWSQAFFVTEVAQQIAITANLTVNTTTATMQHGGEPITSWFNFTLLNNGSATTSYNITIEKTTFGFIDAYACGVNQSTASLSAGASVNFYANFTNANPDVENCRVNISNGGNILQQIEFRLDTRTDFIQLSINQSQGIINITENATYLATIANNGIENHTVNFTFLNGSIETVFANMSQLMNITNGTNLTIFLRVNASINGIYVQTANATASKHGYVSRQTTVTTYVLNEGRGLNFTVNITTASVDGNSLARYRFLLINNGTRAANYTFRANNSQLADVAVLNLSGITLAPLEQQTFNLNVTHASGGNFNVTVNVTVNETLIVKDIVTKTTVVVDTCTPPAINNPWSVKIGDNCTLSTATNLGTGIFSLYGDNGVFRIASGGNLIVANYSFLVDDFDRDSQFVIEIGGRFEVRKP